MMRSNKPVPQYVAQRKVIRWPLLYPLKGESAEHVDQLKLVNSGIIHRIYMLLPKIKNHNPLATISRLRDTYGLKNVRFSVVATKRTRTLLSASYSSEPTPLEPDPNEPERKAA
jgi:hypothetical protein